MLRLLMALYIGLWIAGVVMHFVYTRRLRRVDPQLAERLYPGLWKKSMSSGAAGIRFVLAREFRSVDDPAFVRLSERYRTLLLVWLVVFAVTMVAMLVDFSG